MISMQDTRPTSRRSCPVRWFFCGITTMFLGAMAAAAQQAAEQSEPLQQQVEELKQEYEANNRALLLRIATLEMQIQTEKQAAAESKAGTVSAAELAAQKAAKAAILGGSSNQVGGKFQGDVSAEPTYDQLQEASTKIA